MRVLRLHRIRVPAKQRSLALIDIAFQRAIGKIAQLVIIRRQHHAQTQAREHRHAGLAAHICLAGNATVGMHRPAHRALRQQANGHAADMHRRFDFYPVVMLLHLRAHTARDGIAV